VDLSTFLPSFGNLSLTLLAFVVALSIIVAVHEYGHYIVGRWSGIDADVFSLGFGPVLFSVTDKRGTRWQLAAIPLGGFVKFRGDFDAASASGKNLGRNTMLGAPLWARSSTVAAGPIFNFILSIVVFTGIVMNTGIATDPMVLRSTPDLPPHYQNELQAGDEILAIDGIAINSVSEVERIVDEISEQPVLEYDIRRNGNRMTVTGPYPVTTMALNVSPTGAAQVAGIRRGDVVTAIDDQPVWKFDQMVEIVSTSEGRVLDVDVWRNSETLRFELEPALLDLPRADGSFERRYLIGITGNVFYDVETVSPGVFTSIQLGVEQLWYILRISLSGMWKMVAGELSTCNLSSPVQIAQTSGAMAQAGLVDFISFIGFLSAAVGLLNLLPIPVLDGGHLVFHAYEAVTRRKPSDTALRVLIAGGLGLIFTIMAVALANDLGINACP